MIGTYLIFDADINPQPDRTICRIECRLADDSAPIYKSFQFKFQNVLVFSEPGIDAARDVLDAGEAVVEQQLHGLGGPTAGLAMNENFSIPRQAV